MANVDQSGSRLARHFQNLANLWPVAAAVFMIIVAGAQASAKIADHDQTLKEHGQSIDKLTVGLATLEKGQTDEARRLDEIQRTLDDMRGIKR